MNSSSLGNHQKRYFNVISLQLWQPKRAINSGLVMNHNNFNISHLAFTAFYLLINCNNHSHTDYYFYKIQRSFPFCVLPLLKYYFKIPESYTVCARKTKIIIVMQANKIFQFICSACFSCSQF